MFDDQQNQAVPPTNLPTEPVDMFADTEKASASTPAEPLPDALSAGLLKKKDEVTAMPDNMGGSVNPAPMYAMKEPVLGKIILGVVFIAILGGLGFGGWWVYANYFMKQPVVNTPVQTDLNTASDNTAELPPVTTNEVAPTQTENNIPVVTDTGTMPTDVELNRDMNNDKILFGEPIDTDKDGLDDVREKEIGTDPNVSDTDKDGLIDGDEVIIWKTNPLKADTDGDSYLDGSEVRNGYNPLGPGKLFSPSASTSTSKTTTTNSNPTTTKK